MPESTLPDDDDDDSDGYDDDGDGYDDDGQGSDGLLMNRQRKTLHEKSAICHRR